MVRGMYVNRLMWFRSQYRVKVQQNVLGINFVGQPRLIFKEETPMEDIIKFFFKDKDLQPFEGPDIAEFYGEIIREDLEKVAWKVESVDDIKEACRRFDYSVDFPREIKFKNLVRIWRLREDGIIKGSKKAYNSEMASMIQPSPLVRPPYARDA